MELSPASPNVGYFLLYPQDFWWGDEPLGESARITRAAAEALIAPAGPGIATADVYGFRWPGPYPDNGAVNWINADASFLVTGPQLTSVCDGVDGGLPCAGIGVNWNSNYSGGGSDTPYGPGGGVNALLVEVTAADVGKFGAYNSNLGNTEEFILTCGASADGGQFFLVYTDKAGGEPFGTYTPLADVLTRLQVWRLPTAIWPPTVGEFWRNFVLTSERI